MTNKNQGIVLKSSCLYEQNSLVILDNTMGKITMRYTVMFTKQVISPGFLISYELTQKNRHYMASNIEFLLVPLLFARDNIGFLHHVLELSYYFLSPDDSAQNVYNLLVFLLHYHESIISPFEKKVFLFKFFLEIGMYPEHGMQNIQQLQRMTLREMLDTLNKFDEKVLEQWLIACIGAHPLRKYFKTLPIGIEQCLV